MKPNQITRTSTACALAAVCAFGALSLGSCASSPVEAISSDANPAEIAESTAANESTETPLDASTGRTLLLPDWYFNNTSDEDVIEILLNAGCTSAERSGDNFAVIMPKAYAEAFVAGMKDQVQEIIDDLGIEADALGAALATDEDFATLTLTIPDSAYTTESGSNLALNVKAAAAAAYIYRSAADLGPGSAIIVDEHGTELSRATLPDDHEEILSTAERPASTE